MQDGSCVDLASRTVNPPDFLMLDSFDLRILSALQDDAELTQAALAERVALSPTQCARRLARLREAGYVEKVVYHLNPEVLGLHILAHVHLSLRDHREDSNNKFHGFVARKDEILECYAQTGTDDFLLKVVARDLKHFSEILDVIIRSTGGLASIHSSVVLKTVKLKHQLPLEFVP